MSVIGVKKMTIHLPCGTTIDAGQFSGTGDPVWNGLTPQIRSLPFRLTFCNPRALKRRNIMPRKLRRLVH